MSLTVIQQPGLLSFSKNPIEFHLRSTAYVNQQPVAGVWELAFTTKLTTTAAYHLFEFDGHTVQMYVETTTTPSGYNLPDDITATTLSQYVQALAETWLPAQYLLEKYFTIEYVAGPLIRLTAKDPATVLTVTTTTPGAEATWSTATTPIQLSTLDDYAVIMDIEVEETYGSDEWTRVGTLHAAPVLVNVSGTWRGDVKLDVAELLDGFLQTRTDPPNYNNAAPLIASNTNLQWRAIYSERYAILGSVYHLRRVQTDNKRVLKGGLKYLDVPALPDLETDHFGATDKPWNTWQPSITHVTPEQPHWLYLLTTYGGAGNMRLQAKVYYSDGSSSATTTIATNGSHDQYETWMYRVGFNDEGLNALTPPGVVPYKYEVWMVEDSTLTTVGKVVTFWLDDATRQDRFFFYENSAQGWNTLRCNGDMEAATTVSKTQALNVVQAGYTATEAVVQQKSEGYEDGFTVFTGYKTKAEAIHLREFIHAEKYFEVVDGVLIPVVVDAGSFQLEYDRTGQYAYGLKFRYRHAFINKGYSNA